MANDPNQGAMTPGETIRLAVHLGEAMGMLKSLLWLKSIKGTPEYELMKPKVWERAAEVVARFEAAAPLIAERDALAAKLAEAEKRAVLPAELPEPPVLHLIEHIAAQWDGCEYDAGPGGIIDIGEAIRMAAGNKATLESLKPTTTSQPAPQAAQAAPVESIQDFREWLRRDYAIVSMFSDRDMKAAWHAGKRFGIAQNGEQAAPVDAPPPSKDRIDLCHIIHDMVVAQQAAWIEWQHGAGAEAGMRWIHNGLCGPGHIPDEDAPYGKEPQAYFDANKSDPFPTCKCGRPSNTLWMGQGFCGNEHYREAKALAASKQGGAA